MTRVVTSTISSSMMPAAFMSGISATDLFGGAPIRPTDMHAVEPDGSIRVAAEGLEFPNGFVS